MGLTAPWPLGLSRAAIRHCPRHLHADAMQVAWLANQEGRNPDSAVRALVRNEERHRAAKPNFERCSTRSVRRRF